MRWKTVQACDQAALMELWKKAQESSICGGLEGRTFQDYYDMMQESCMLFELPYGMVRVDHRTKPGQTWVHGEFWSPEVFRNIETLRELMIYIMDTVGVTRIYTIIPADKRGLPHLLERAGARWAGTAPQYFKRGDALFDGLLYTMDYADGVGGMYAG